MAAVTDGSQKCSANKAIKTTNKCIYCQKSYKKSVCCKLCKIQIHHACAIASNEGVTESWCCSTCNEIAINMDLSLKTPLPDDEEDTTQVVTLHSLANELRNLKVKLDELNEKIAKLTRENEMLHNKQTTNSEQPLRLVRHDIEPPLNIVESDSDISKQVGNARGPLFTSTIVKSSAVVTSESGATSIAHESTTTQDLGTISQSPAIGSDFPSVNSTAVPKSQDDLITSTKTMKLPVEVEENSPTTKVIIKSGIASGEKIFNVKQDDNKKIKVVVVTDSHGRGLGKILSDNLTNNYEVSVFVKPGANLGVIVNKAIQEAEKMRGGDWLVVMGGSNDIGITPLSLLSANLKKLLPVSLKCKLIITSIPRRAIKESNEWNLNKVIRETNIVMHNAVNDSKNKCAKNIRFNFLDKKIFKEHLDSDGLHLNGQGKTILCDSIIHFLPITKLDRPVHLLNFMEKWLINKRSKGSSLNTHSIGTNIQKSDKQTDSVDKSTFLERWLKIMKVQ